MVAVTLDLANFRELFRSNRNSIWVFPSLLVTTWCFALIFPSWQAFAFSVAFTYVLSLGTIFHGVFLMLLAKDCRRLGLKAIFERTLIAIGLTFATLLLWPRTLWDDKHTVASNQLIKAKVGIEAFMEKNTPALIAKVPIGETEWGTFQDDRLRIFFGSKPMLDPWNHPYILVAESRKTGLWLGAYSKGKDGVSSSNGNDPDDINTWSDSPIQFYQERIDQKHRQQLAMETVLSFAFFETLCLCAFRPKSKPQQQHPYPTPAMI